MPSFDIVNRVDLQAIDNAVNNAMREISQRFDFRNTHSELVLDRAEKKIQCHAPDKMKMEAVREIFMANAVRQHVNPKAFQFGDAQPTSGGALKREVRIREGIDREIAQRIVKWVKDSKLKVQAAIQGEELRVSGKKIDDLQAVIALLKQQELEIPIQFVNLRS